MRLFIAIELPKDVEENIQKIQKQLKGKLTLTKTYHLTLKFLGEVQPDKLEQIKKKLETIKYKKFTATTNNMGFFPNEKNIRVIWIGIEPEQTICELQKQIEQKLEGLFEKEQNYKPHITLARAKYPDEQLTENIKIKTQPMSFEIKEIKLIESKLLPTGPEYKTIQMIPLE